MTDWLLDTLIWTAALIALVLVIRRPVARWFGAQAAYALWAVPLLRLALPPLTLPAWMAPVEPVAPVAAAPETMFIVVEPAMAAEAAPMFPFTLVEVVLAAWLAGVVTFLFLRFRAYREMRQDMLAEAREVGRAGKVRLVETPSTSAPLAFGVIDKVVALPVGFLASWDREARDLALEHELAHHRGHDLLINMAVQPLFALYWFNPLGHLGWMALRRDQEAACDARVVSAAEPEILATYARVIASFAAGPNVALAAPMACPVLGEKSIIHRLRSLKMNNHSQRRRLAGRGLLAAALVALPLTATVTYAESMQDAPEAPAAPTPPTPPTAPTPPTPPEPPVAPEAPEHAVKTFVIKREMVQEHEGHADGHDPKEVRKIRIVRNGEEVSDAEMKEMMAEMRRDLAEANKDIDEAMREQHVIIKQMQDGKHPVRVEMKCDGKGPASEWTGEDGKKVVMVCKSEIMASAISGLRSARDEIAGNKEMPEDVRKEVLKELDAQIKEWEKRNKS